MSSQDEANQQLNDLMLDGLDLGSSITGIADPTPISDGVGAAVSYARGDYWGIALSVVSMVPYAGDAIAKPFKGSRIVASMTNKVENLIELLPKLKKEGGAAAELAAKIEGQLEKLRGKFCSLPGAKKLCALLERQAQKAAKELEEKAEKEVGEDVAKTVDKKPYSDPKNRPKYDENQVDDVWETAKQPDGKVYDPNTGEVLEWDKSKSRAGQWDMGHKPGKEYRKLQQDYLDGKISKEEFLQEYRNPNNYQPEAPSANRSRKYEAD